MTDPTADPLRSEGSRPQQGPMPAAPGDLPEPAPLTFQGAVPGEPVEVPTPSAAPQSPYEAPASPYEARQPEQPLLSSYAAPPSAYPPHAVPGHPYQPYPGYPPPRHTNGLAVASMVVSLAGVALACVYGIGAAAGPVGAILGHMARRKIRETGEEGDAFALTGIIVGWILTGLLALLVIGLVLLVIGLSSGAI